MTSQILTVTVHNPRVESVHRLTNDPANLLMITLGNGEYHGHVTLLMSDADWNSIGMAVSAFLDGEGLQSADLRDADLKSADLRNADLQTRYIPTTDYGGSDEL